MFMRLKVAEWLMGGPKDGTQSRKCCLIRRFNNMPDMSCSNFQLTKAHRFEALFICVTMLFREQQVEKFGRFVRSMDDSVKQLSLVCESNVKKHQGRK